MADSSVWVDHFRKPDSELLVLLEGDELAGHPFIFGELALGNLPDRANTLAKLAGLPQVAVSSHFDVFDLIERERLDGSGLGYVDAHLLASTLLTPDTQLWTRDRRLHAAAERLGVAA